MNEIRVVDPGFEGLDLLRTYNLVGIANTRVLKIPAGNKLITRYGLLTTGYTQILVEIWSSSLTMEPKFAADWRSCQLNCLREIAYHGNYRVGTRVLPTFRLTSKRADATRFCWLSSDSDDFWIKPTNFSSCQEVSFPEIHHSPGLLRMSEGSRIGNAWSRKTLQITTKYSGIQFSDLSKLKIEISGTIHKRKGGRFVEVERTQDLLFP